MRVHTRYAKGEFKPKTKGLLGTVFRFSCSMLAARVSGGYKQTPFFDAQTGTPIVVPTILSSEQHASLMNSL